MVGPNNANKRDMDALSRLSWHDFEHLLAEHYRDQGYRVEHFGTAGSLKSLEGSVDLRLRRGSEFVIAQCRHWDAKEVSASDVQLLLGTMLNEAANSAVLITRGKFTPDARKAASRQPRLRLVDGEILRVMLKLPEHLGAVIPETDPVRASGKGAKAHRTKRRTASETSRLGPILLAAIIILMLGIFAWRVMNPPKRPVEAAAPPVATPEPAQPLVPPVVQQPVAPPPVIPAAPPPPVVRHPEDRETQRKSEDAMKVMEQNTREVGKP
ncbi:restriction endonuclease [Luteibacter rhizovicinus]|uniref:Restriction endonuclease n=2 Tax=Luteibacter rhizovicinus TaxID=242606 RepID=A0A4R3YKZ2_9GAMM|nr:restriction endonuclease [Luteibacter rhizovicinus]